MKILITGEKGDLGNFFYNQIKKKHKVYTTNQMNKLKNLDLFIHMGASGPKRNFNKIVKSNILKLKSMFLKLKKVKIKQIIFFSSTSVYGSYENSPIDEKKIFKNQSIYGISKIYGENFFLNNYDFNVTCLRIPAVLTKNNFNHYIGMQVKRLMRNQDVILDSRNKKFNFFLDPNNLLEFIITKKKLRENQIINLSSNNEWSLFKIINYLKNKLNSKSKIIIIRKEKKNFILSNEKAKKKFNFKPYKTLKTLNNWIKKLENEKN